MKNTTTKLIIAVLAVVLLIALSGCESSDYKQAMSLYEAGNYQEAADLFATLGDFEDSPQMRKACHYELALEELEAGNYEEAAEAFEDLEDYEDSEDHYNACLYTLATQAMEAGDYDSAKQQFEKLGDYEDAAHYAKWMTSYQLAAYLKENGPKTYDPQSEDYSVKLSLEGEDVFVLDYNESLSDGVNHFDLHYVARIPLGSDTAELTATSTFSNDACQICDNGSGVWDIASYTYGADVQWDNYNVIGSNTDGTPLDSDIQGICSSSVLPLSNMTYGLNLILYLVYTDCGVVVTVADLGFAAMG